MYKLEDIIEDLKTEKPEVSVWEVIECLEQAQDTISDLQAKVKELTDAEEIAIWGEYTQGTITDLQAKVEDLEKDKIAIGRNVKEMVREFDVERIERINYAKALEAKVEELEERERWIPVSECLPDTDQPLHVMIKARRAGQELYAKSISYLPAYGGFDHHYDPVIAWKPIHPPQEGE